MQIILKWKVESYAYFEKWLVDSVDYFKEESYPLVFRMIYSGYDNRTRQTGQVIRYLYSLDRFYTRLGERASANFQPALTSASEVIHANF